MEPILSADQPMTRTILLNSDLQERVLTHSIEVRRIRIRAGYPAGVHVHNGPVVGSIDEGSVLFQVDGQAQTVLRPGDVFLEPAEVRILHFDALDEDVTFLAYFLLTPGQVPEIVLPEG